MRKLTLILAAAALAACDSPADPGVETTPGAEKPEFDPSQGMLDNGKADFASNHLTTLMGTAPLGERFEGQIAYPDYLHGYTIELRAGQVIHVTIKSTAAQVGAAYGPAQRFRDDGRPVFRKPLAVEYARRDTLVELTVEAPDDGLYMLVTGPLYVWKADYSIETVCLEGCLPADACANDSVCADGEFCGDNGVRCFRAPCDVNYDVCQPRLDEGQWCDRDSMCGPGLRCFGDACAAPEQPVCEDDAQCGPDAWCGFADREANLRVCKPFRLEGERCGGFVPADLATRCAPGLACVADPRIADVPGNCSVMATVEELQANPERFADRYVAVEGDVGHRFAMCTQMACTPENPCCNSCGAEQQLFEKGVDPAAGPEGLSLNGPNEERYGCGGNSCNWQDQCSLEEGGYRVLGTFRRGEYADTIDVDHLWPTAR